MCGCCRWGHSGDGCDLELTLCKYDLRKGNLFVLGWARVRQVRQGSISLELLMCGGGVQSILLLPLVARCLETIDVCIWCMFVFTSVVGRLPIHTGPETDTHAHCIPGRVAGRNDLSYKQWENSL